MSDKTVGIIGQKYEDRKTGKCGVLESRDEKYKTLMFMGDDGRTFSISNSSFRSNWRKVKEETVEVETEPVENDIVEETVEQEEVAESVEEPTSEPEVKPKKRKAKSEKKSSESAPSKNYSNVTKEEAIATFIESIMTVRNVSVTNDTNRISIFVDDHMVVHIVDNGDDIFGIAMLPDVFTLSEWKGILNTRSIQYKIGAKDYLGVIADTNKTCIPEILDIIMDAVKDINLYGYILEEDETDGEN